MTGRCRVCLGELPATASDYHPRCVRGVFGSGRVPALDLETGKLHTAALAMVGTTSLSGVQKKISLGLSTDRKTLQVAAGGVRFILKPPTDVYPALPENEHLCTRLARLAKIETAPGGLVALADGPWALVVRRFDRTPEGLKLAQEDFCQLAGKRAREKYEGSAELLIRLLRRYASEPLVEIAKLYRRLLFSWWIGNGDMHLKNFSLLTGQDGVVGLSPAYDLVATRLLIPDDSLALPVGGKRDRLTRSDWLALAQYGGLPPRAAVRPLKQLAELLPRAQELVSQCFLPAEQRRALADLLRERTASL